MKKIGLFLAGLMFMLSCMTGVSANTTSWTNYPFGTPLSADTFLFGAISRGTNMQITAANLLAAIGGTSSTLPPAQFYLGNALSNASPVSFSGAFAVNTNGVATLNSISASLITSGTVPTAQLGTGGTANTILHGNQIFSAVSLSADVTGTLSGSSVSGGTFGAVNASALTALNASQLSSGVAGIGVGGTAQTTARTAGNTIGILQMTANPASIVGPYQDMTNATSTYIGQIGISLGGGSPDPFPFLWYASASGVSGTNAWGRVPLSIENGLYQMGNWNFASDLPNQFGQAGTQFFYQNGPNASTKEAAYNYVASNYNTSTAIQQPRFQVIGGNPWTSAPFIEAVASFTNASHGALVGTNVDGIKIYTSTFGLAFGQIGDGYMSGTTNGQEFQQAPSEQVALSSDGNLVKYISMNATRAGDSQQGQVPLLAIDTRNNNINGGPMLAGFPYQVANVWATTNPLWRWALAADEISGVVYAATNATLISSNHIMTGTFSTGAIDNSVDLSSRFNINETNGGIFNFDGNYPAVWTFDYTSSSHRMGIGILNGNSGIGVMYAKSSAFYISHLSGTDLRTGLSGQTYTNEAYWDDFGTTHLVALATSGTATGTITSTGWTNTTGTNCDVNVIGTAVSFIVFDNAGTAWATNTTVTGGMYVPLQAAGKITAASGLTGTWHVQ